MKSSWKQVKRKLKEKYAVLTDKDLEYEEGQEDQLIRKLQDKLGKTKSEVKEILRNLE